MYPYTKSVTRTHFTTKRTHFTKLTQRIKEDIAHFTTQRTHFTKLTQRIVTHTHFTTQRIKEDKGRPEEEQRKDLLKRSHTKKILLTNFFTTQRIREDQRKDLLKRSHAKESY